MGDLALYLVTRGLSTSDVTDSAKEGQIDYPDSVVALLEGRLGFPHKGFPEEVRKNYFNVFALGWFKAAEFLSGGFRSNRHNWRVFTGWFVVLDGLFGLNSCPY